MKLWQTRIELSEDPSRRGRKVSSMRGASWGLKKRWQYSVSVSRLREIVVIPVLRFLGNSSRSSTVYSGSHGSWRSVMSSFFLLASRDMHMLAATSIRRGSIPGRTHSS